MLNHRRQHAGYCDSEGDIYLGLLKGQTHPAQLLLTKCECGQDFQFILLPFSQTVQYPTLSKPLCSFRHVSHMPVFIFAALVIQTAGCLNL